MYMNRCQLLYDGVVELKIRELDPPFMEPEAGRLIPLL